MPLWQSWALRVLRRVEPGQPALGAPPTHPLRLLQTSANASDIYPPHPFNRSLIAEGGHRGNAKVARLLSDTGGSAPVGRDPPPTASPLR